MKLTKFLSHTCSHASLLNVADSFHQDPFIITFVKELLFPLPSVCLLVGCQTHLCDEYSEYLRGELICNHANEIIPFNFFYMFGKSILGQAIVRHSLKDYFNRMYVFQVFIFFHIFILTLSVSKRMALIINLLFVYIFMLTS